MPDRATGARQKANADPAPRAHRDRRARTDGAPALTRQAIANAAFRLADADGLQAVSIRRVAAELDVGPMSLYTHVADKADLLALTLNEFIALTLAEEPLPADWRNALSETARRSHAAFVAHPWVLEVIAQRPSLGDNAVKQAKQRARAVEGLGLETAEAWTLLAIVNDYVLGHALRVASTGIAEGYEDALSPGDLAELPDLAQLPNVDAERSWSERFEIGLQTVLDGIEQRFLTRPARHRASARARKARAPRADT